MYNSQTTSIVNDLRAKSPTKADTDHHNGDLKNVTFSSSDSACYHQVSSIILNHHSIIHLIISLPLTLLSLDPNKLSVKLIYHWSFCCGWNQNVAVLLLSDPWTFHL